MIKIILFSAFIMSAALSCWATQFDDLVKLVKSGMTEDVVIAFIDASKRGYALNADNIVQLKTLGASDKVIAAAIQHKPAIDSSAQESNSAASATQSANVVQQSTPEAVVSNPPVVYETLPAYGGWVLINDYWYWQYPTGMIVDLGWHSNNYYYHDRHFSRGYGGRGGRGGHR